MRTTSSNSKLVAAIQPLWQLSRFDTRESWLACYPAMWGLSLAIKHYNLAISGTDLAGLVASNWLCMTLIHSAFCTWNDILDAEIDKFAARTATRPLPSGRCSPAKAHTWFYVQLFVANIAMHTLLGPATHMAMLPCLALSFFYPLSKRYISWPQFVLAPTVGWPVFAGWLSAQAHAGLHEKMDLSICAPAFASYAVWTVYYDTCYGLQDIAGDEESGVGSLAQFLGVTYIKPFLLGLNVVALGFLGLAAERSRCSLVLRAFGVGFWALSVPFQFRGLDPTVPGSGGKIFKFNISLGMYVTMVVLAEAWIGGVWKGAGHAIWSR